jgi:hypothetical protein
VMHQGGGKTWAEKAVESKFRSLQPASEGVLATFLSIVPSESVSN